MRQLAKHFINSLIKYLLSAYSVPGILHMLSSELPQTALPVSHYGSHFADGEIQARSD